ENSVRVQQLQPANIEAAFETTSQDRFQEPVIQRIYPFLTALDLAFVTIAESGDLRCQQLVPQLPAQTFRDLAGDLSSATTVLAVDGQYGDHDNLYIAAVSPPARGSFLFRKKTERT